MTKISTYDIPSSKDDEYYSFLDAYEISKTGRWWTIIICADTEQKRVIQLRKYTKKDGEWKKFSNYGINSSSACEKYINALTSLHEDHFS